MSAGIERTLEEHQDHRTVEALLSCKRIAFSRFSRGGYPLKSRKRRLIPYLIPSLPINNHEDVLQRVCDLARGPISHGKIDPPRYIFRTIFLRDRSCDFSKNRANAASYPKQTPPLSINIPPQLSDSVRHHARRSKSENSRNAPFASENRNFSEIEVAISPRIAQKPRLILFQHLRDR